MSDAFQTRLGIPMGLTISPGFNNFSLNGNTDAAEWIFQSPDALTITRLFCRLGTITGTTPTYRISLQGVGATGVPDGTIKGATNNALKTFSPSSLGWSAGSGNWLTLDETYAASRGEMLSIVIDYSSGTVDGSNFASFSTWMSAAIAANFPYAIQNDATVRTKQTGVACYGFGTAGAKYGRPMQAFSSLSNITSASNPREVGFVFTVPSGWSNTLKLLGVRFNHGNIAGSSSFTIRLYQGGAAADTGTVLQDVTIDSDHQSAPTNNGEMLYLFDEASLSSLTAGSSYRISFENLSVTSWIGHVASQASGDDWDAWPFATQMQHTSRASGGNWSDDDTIRWRNVQLVLADIAGSATGGGYVIGA